MNHQPPKKLADLRPKFGVGVVIGALVILASQMSGSDSFLGMALGGGAGILLGLTQLARTEGPVPKSVGENGGETGR